MDENSDKSDNDEYDDPNNEDLNTKRLCNSENNYVYQSIPPNGIIIVSVVFFVVLLILAFYVPKYYKQKYESKRGRDIEMQRGLVMTSEGGYDEVEVAEIK
jgi:hypothetical protein